MPASHTQVQNVGGGSGTVVHMQGGDLHQAADKTDLLPRLRSRTYRGINNGA